MDSRLVKLANTYNLIYILNDEEAIMQLGFKALNNWNKNKFELIYDDCKKLVDICAFEDENEDVKFHTVNSVFSSVVISNFEEDIKSNLTNAFELYLEYGKEIAEKTGLKELDEVDNISDYVFKVIETEIDNIIEKAA